MEKLYNILIVKYGEIGVKGKNRYIFENKLIKNVKNILKPIGKFNVYKEYGLLPDCSIDNYGALEMEAFLAKEKFLREKGDKLISELRVLAEEDEEIQQLISDYDNGKSEIILTPDKQDVMLHLRDTKELMYRK